MEASKSEVSYGPAAQRSCRDSESSQLENSFLVREAGVFVLFRPSTGWMRPSSDYVRQTAYSNFTNLNKIVVLSSQVLQFDT